MFDFMKNELYYELDTLVSGGEINNERLVVMFGYNHYARLSVSYLLGAGIKLSNLRIIDNFVCGEYKNIIIQKPEEVLKPYRQDAVILLATTKNKDIIRELRQFGYKGKQVKVTLNRTSAFYKIGSRLRIEKPDKYNALLNGIAYRWYKNTHADICRLTEQNERFKNIHKGKRCFILGNGPSVKDIDLEKLKDEIVFGVNQVMGLKGWEKADINYWVCIDGDFLGLWADADLDFFEQLKKLGNKNIQGFVPVEAKRNIERYKVNDIMSMNYVNFKLQYINLDQKVHMEDVDMKKFIIQPYNVVVACINIAIYMGFSEIYLLGCNHTVLCSELSVFLENQLNSDMHAVEGRDISAEITANRLKNKGMYFELKTQVTQLMQFSVMADLCRRKNIKLINLSEPTLIESIEHMPASEVLGK